MVSPPLHPKATHLPCASLKTRNITELQRRKKKRVGGLFVCVLRVSEIKAPKKLDKNNSNNKPWDTDDLLT